MIRDPRLRKRDLEAAIANAKDDDVSTQADLSKIWGVSTARFSDDLNKIRMTVNFPDWRPGLKNARLYPTKAALEALLAYHTRNDAATAARQASQARLLGVPEPGKRRRREAEPEYIPTAREQIEANRLRRMVEEDERRAGEWIRKSDVEDLAGRIYGITQDFFDAPSRRFDPNGQLDTVTRARMDAAGRATLLQISKQIGDILDADADSIPSRPSGPQRSNRRAARASTRG